MKSLRKWLVIGLVVGAGALVSAQITNVLNSAADLSGKTLVTAEGNRTISGTFTYSVPVKFAAGTSGSPGITLSTDTSTGIVLGSGTMSFSLSGTQNALLNSSGFTFSGNLIGPVIYDNGNSGAAIAINFSTHPAIQKVTRTASCTYTLTAPAAPATVVLEMIHEASATAYTVTFSPTPKYPSGIAPTYTDTSGAIDIVTLFWDGTNWYAVQTPSMS